MNRPLQQRFATLPAPHPLNAISRVEGGAADYHPLAAHHYRAGRPGTMMRVLAFRDKKSTAAARFRGERAASRTVAVLVESLPMLQGRMRDRALHGRYSAWSPAERARLLNAEFRCISRVVVHPQYRGPGLAARLVHAALRSAPTPLNEAYVAMDRAHPFFEKAGMTPYAGPMSPARARLLEALQALRFDRLDLAMLKGATGLSQRIVALPQAQQQWLKRELQRWHRQTCRRRSGARNELVDVDAMLRAAQSRLLLKPIYYLHDNHGSEGGEEAVDAGMRTD